MPAVITRRFLLGALAASATLALIPAWADGSYPTKQIHMIIPFPPGGATDIIGRLIADGMAPHLKQAIVVENRAGAAGVIGIGAVSRAKPDGYTIALGNISTQTISPALLPDISYDPILDFEGIALTGRIANVLVVHPSLNIHSVQELIDRSKEAPDSLSYGSSGSGGTPHMSAELFKLRTGTTLLHVPYKGGGPMLTDLLGGHVDLAFGNMPDMLPHIQAGKLIALAVTSAQRSFNLPDVPTLMEAGVADYDVTSWFGLFSPKGTPESVIASLGQAAVKAQENPELVQTLNDRGVALEALSGQAFNDYVKQQRLFWSDFIAQTGIQSSM